MNEKNCLLKHNSIFYFDQHRGNSCVRRFGGNSCRAGKPLPVVGTVYSRRGHAPSAKGLLLIPSLFLTRINEGNSGFHSEISHYLRVQHLIQILKSNKQTKETLWAKQSKTASQQCVTHA